VRIQLRTSRAAALIYLQIGLPSRFGEWCTRVLCGLVQAAVGEFDLASGDTLDQLAVASIKAKAPHLVLVACQPSGDLRAALACIGRRFIVALDDPYAALHNLVTEHGIEWKSAIRATAASCASTVTVDGLPGALVLRASCEGGDTAAAASAIANWLDLDVTSADLAALVQKLPNPVSKAAQQELEAWRDRTLDRDRSIAEGALRGYMRRLERGEMSELIWTRELFFLGDDPNKVADGIIEISGPVRNLFFGPYIMVPIGRWQITVHLAISKQEPELPYSIEVLAGPDCDCLARETRELHSEVIAEISAEFAVLEFTAQPISVRVANLRPALAGRLALVQVTVTPLQKASLEIPAELKTALGSPNWTSNSR